MHIAGDPILGGDGAEYERYATNIVDHLAYSNALSAPYFASVFRTPGYPLFLALFRLLDPNSWVLVRCAQFALLGLTAFLTYRLSLFVTTRRVALISAVLCATFLPFVWLATYQLTEILATFLATAVVFLIFRARAGTAGSEKRTLRRYAALGAVTGLLSLVRPEDGLVVALIAGGLFVANRHVPAGRRLRGVGVLLVGFLVVVVPWTVRNAVVAHEVIPVGANSGQSLYISAQQYAGRISYSDTHADYERLYGSAGLIARVTGHRSPYASPLSGSSVEVASNSALESAAVGTFERLTIGTVLRSLPSRVAHLWGTADYPPQGRSFSASAHRLAVVQYSVILALAALGMFIAMLAGRTELWPLLLFPIYTTLVHLVFNVEARFTIPDRPSAIIFASMGLAWLAQLTTRWLRMSPREYSGSHVTYTRVRTAPEAPATGGLSPTAPAATPGA
jgi:4-amino-4-deoxy-L-arabinose transferase-like glycosyltransferase